MKDLVIRKAEKGDCQAMSALLALEAERTGFVLKRSPEQIASMLANYFVALLGGKVVGTCGHKVWNGGLTEVISWVSEKRYRGQGIGSKLLDRCLKEIKSHGFTVIFTLTVEVERFERRGFRRVDIRSFPAKILADCQFCKRRDADGDPLDPKCPEVAMRLVR